MDGASFDFDDFIFGSDAKAVQSGVGTSIAIEVIETAGTSGEASSYLSDSRPPRLSQGDLIPIIYSLETHAWTLHRFPVSSCLLFLS